jgi:hypothetical protein
MTLESVELVQVIWNDACHARSLDKATGLKVMSFGLLIKDEADGIVLAQSQSAVGEFVDCLYIPRSIVVEVTRVPLPGGKGVIPT